MSRTNLLRLLVPAVVAAAVLVGPAADNAMAQTPYRCVVTVYNKTNIPLYYQLRAYRGGQWTEWSSQKHKQPRGGWFCHWYDNAEKMQIRFDRIGGDDEYTEKIYNLKFNRIDQDEDVNRHLGRPYYFSFDAGGQLLDLYKNGW